MRQTSASTRAYAYLVFEGHGGLEEGVRREDQGGGDDGLVVVVVVVVGGVGLAVLVGEDHLCCHGGRSDGRCVFASLSNRMC